MPKEEKMTDVESGAVQEVELTLEEKYARLEAENKRLTDENQKLKTQNQQVVKAFNRLMDEYTQLHVKQLLND